MLSIGGSATVESGGAGPSGPQTFQPGSPTCPSEGSVEEKQMANQGIPTIYNWRRYRSRLEARWAVMFDLLGWQAEYEPFDCNGWIPDFGIRMYDGTFMLAEVKPIAAFDEETAAKIDAANKEHEVLLLGAILPESQHNSSYQEYPQIGWLREIRFWEMGWSGAMVGIFDKKSNRIGVCSEDGGWTDRVTGIWEKWVYASHHLHLAGISIDRLWAEAGNRTQWKAAANG